MKVIDKLHVPDNYDCYVCKNLDTACHCKATGNSGQDFSLFHNSKFHNNPLQLVTLEEDGNKLKLSFVFHRCNHYEFKKLNTNALC